MRKWESSAVFDAKWAENTKNGVFYTASVDGLV
jgi:hypothetical protein